jgi:hypothetical protein
MENQTEQNKYTNPENVKGNLFDQKRVSWDGKKQKKVVKPLNFEMFARLF